LNGCDIAFLCLPDDAAREAVGFIENPDVVVIDTSTAHRTEPGWSYGFPELGDDFADAIKGSKRITVPGCHAGGFIALVYPLVRAGIILQSARLFCHSVTGYSGGGKKMIAEYEAANRPYTYASPRQYALTQNHKHLKEMQKIAGLSHSPVFCPVVADFYSGMVVTVPLFREDLANAAPEDIRGLYS